MPGGETFTLTSSWGALESELRRLALSPAQAALIPHLIEPLRRQAMFLTPDLMLREILCLAACVTDPSFSDAMESEGSGRSDDSA